MAMLNNQMVSFWKLLNTQHTHTVAKKMSARSHPPRMPWWIFQPVADSNGKTYQQWYWMNIDYDIMINFDCLFVWFCLVLFGFCLVLSGFVLVLLGFVWFCLVLFGFVCLFGLFVCLLFVGWLVGWLVYSFNMQGGFERVCIFISIILP